MIFSGDSIERVAAHETGHAVLALSFGVDIVRVSVAPKEQLPTALARADSGFFVESSSSRGDLDPRIQSLLVAGGMAAELVVFGKYFILGALDDLAQLRQCSLNDEMIRRLCELAKKPLLQNRVVFDNTRVWLAEQFERADQQEIEGALLNERFRKEGVIVSIPPEELDLIIPADWPGFPRVEL